MLDDWIGKRFLGNGLHASLSWQVSRKVGKSTCNYVLLGDSLKMIRTPNRSKKEVLFLAPVGCPHASTGGSGNHL